MPTALQGRCPTVEGAKVVVEVVEAARQGRQGDCLQDEASQGLAQANGHREQFTQVEVKQVIA
jgi:hypothetical protein